MTFYTFANATSAIPLANLDANFATPITLGNTAVTINGTFSSIGNLTLNNATIASGNSTVTKETVTTITSPAATNLTIQSAGTTAMTIDTSQNVGIGTSSPSARLSVSGVTPFLTGGNGQLSVFSTDAIGADKGGKISFGGVSGSGNQYDPYGFCAIAGLKNNATASDYSGYLTFSTSNSGGTVAERMRIDSSGNVLVGATSFSYTAKVNVNGSQYMTGGSYETWNGAYNLYQSTTNYIGVQFYKSATNSLSGATRQAVIEVQVDNHMDIKTDVNIPIWVIANASNGVTLTGGATSWASLSDGRLKNITGNIDNALSVIQALEPIKFNWKSDAESKPQVGLLAQSVQPVLPEAVEPVIMPNDETKTEYLSVKYTDVIPVLVAAIQELKAEFDAYKASHP